jgi:uncharacterized protein (TIGR02996 family)
MTKTAHAGDEASVRAEIAARPDDDAPRLVLADLLQAKGDPQGELIAVQVKLAKLAADDSARAALVKREKALLRDPAIVAFGDEVRRKHGVVIKWHRGFIGHIGISGSLLAKSKVFAAVPTIDSLDVGGCIACNNGALPELARLRALTIGTGTAEHVPHLDLEVLAGVRSLKIEKVQLEKAIPAIVAWKHLKPAVLDLTKTNIRNGGGDALAAAALEVDRLILVANKLDDAARAKLSKVYGKRVVFD